MDIVLNAIRGAGGVIAFGLRMFAMVAMAINLLFGVSLAGLCFWIAANGSTMRGVIAAVVAVLMAVVLSLVAGAAFAVSLTAGRLVRDAALGQKIFDELFGRVLGVTNDTPEGGSKLTKSVHGLTASEVEAKINGAVGQLLGEDELDGSLTGLARRFAARVQRIAVWATVKVIVRQCRASSLPDAPVDLVALRDKLSGHVDGLVLNFLRGHVVRLFAAVASILFVVAVLLAFGVRQLPI